MATHPHNQGHRGSHSHADEPLETEQAAPKDAPPKPLRKIVAIAAMSNGNGAVLALCDDGTLWAASPLTAQWGQVDTSTVDFGAAIVETGPGGLVNIPATAGGLGAHIPS